MIYIPSDLIFDLIPLTITCIILILLVTVLVNLMNGVKCPKCKAKGEIVWVIPGQRCHKCGNPCLH